MTEFELFKALRPLYPAEQFALLPQAANSTGFSASRHADALALGLWPSRGIHLHGFEIKSYRGDWLRELKDPKKAEEIAGRCHHWWIVAGGPFVKPEEVPAGWGLLSYDEGSGLLKRVKAAPYREAAPMDLSFVAAMLRKAQEVVTPDAVVQAAKTEGFNAGQKAADIHGRDAVRQYTELKAKVDSFEKETGLHLTGWRPAKEVAAAVNQVLNGSYSNDRQSLVEICQRVLRDLNEPENAVVDPMNVLRRRRAAR